MKCPYCGHPDSKVTDSRLSKDGAVTRRRRECPGCEKRFTTREYVEAEPAAVIKRDGSREEFDRHKIIAGLKKSCEKRPVPTQALEQLAADIEREIGESGEREVDSRAIGEKVIERLRAIDEVAYVRFASVYRQFRDAREFMEELAELERRRGSE
jgi:transcriptional repressor NrdR